MVSVNYPIRTPLMNVMIQAVQKAGHGLIRDFENSGRLNIKKKGSVNFVSDADLRSERTLQRELSKARPKFGFLMEESGVIDVDGAEYRWVIDPLDGTTNFLHEVPYFCISVAVEKKIGESSEIVAGIIYDPIHDEMFMAEKGEGAYVNHRRLRCSERSRDFYFVTGTSRRQGDAAEQSSKIVKYATSKLECTLRRSGAAALDLAYVAAGRYDACWFSLVQKWDMAAGIILVKESGGYIDSLDEKGSAYETGGIFAASEKAYNMLPRR